MKRMIALLLAAVMLLSMLTWSVAASETVTVTVGSVSGEIGDTVQVPVSVSDGHYLVNGRIFLSYDPTVLELQTVCEDEYNPYFETVNADIFDSSFMWGFASPAAGSAKFVFATSKDTGSATGGVMFTLTFKLLKEADTSAVTLAVPEMCANDGSEDRNAVLTLVDGSVTVTKPDLTPAIPGDVNGDGLVTLPDAVRLLYYVNGMVSLTDKQTINADVTGDGTVGLADAVRLFYFVSGQIGEL